MNKVLLISDYDELPQGAFDFACMLNEQHPIMLDVVFLPKDGYRDALYYFSYGIGVPLSEDAADDTEVMIANAAEIKFRKLCQEKGIAFHVREKEYMDLEEHLKTETRFADLLLLSNKLFYGHRDGDLYGDYAGNPLHYAECPVIMVPDTYQKPDNIILAYDGTASSVYAIRQFANLMPGLASEKTLLIYVNPDKDQEFPGKTYIEELAMLHYSNLTFLKLNIDAKKYFATWLADRKNTLLVTGAQGRSEFSRIMNKSFISDVLKEDNMPVFIAHR